MSMVVVLIAAGILTGTVLYSVSLMRSVEIEILTGERVNISDSQGDFQAYPILD